MEDLIHRGLGIADHIARQYQQPRNHVFYSDLFSAGNAAVWEAARRWPVPGFTWSQFAATVVTRRILDEKRKLLGTKRRCRIRFVSAEWVDWGKEKSLPWHISYSQLYSTDGTVSDGRIKPSGQLLGVTVFGLIRDGKTISEVVSLTGSSRTGIANQLALLRRAFNMPMPRKQPLDVTAKDLVRYAAELSRGK